MAILGQTEGPSSSVCGSKCLGRRTGQHRCPKHPPSFQVSSNFNSLWWRARSGTPRAPVTIHALVLALTHFMFMSTPDIIGLTVQPSWGWEGGGADRFRNITLSSVFSELYLPLNLHEVQTTPNPNRVFQIMCTCSAHELHCLSGNQCLSLKDRPSIYHSLLP